MGSEVVGWLFPSFGWSAVFGLLFMISLSALLCIVALSWASTPAARPAAAADLSADGSGGNSDGSEETAGLLQQRAPGAETAKD